MAVPPSFLLAKLDLLRAAAPWCVPLDNLEAAIVMLTQPWLAGDGVRRADLERQLERLGDDLPLGKVYFQRVNRAVAGLEGRGCLRGTGQGRARGFVATPEGFAALIVNLRVLRSDPTLEPAEFEFKRGLVAMWCLVAERVAELPEEPRLAAGDDSFLAAACALEVLGRPVVTDEVVCETLDVLRLIANQAERVRELRAGALRRRADAGRAAAALAGVDLRSLVGARFGEGAAVLVEDPQAAELVRGLAEVALPELAVEAAMRRYDAYLEYLQSLRELYSDRLKVVDLATLRRLSGAIG